MKAQGDDTYHLATEHGLDTTYKLRCGFKHLLRQAPFFMLWREHWYSGEVVHAECLYVQEGLEP